MINILAYDVEILPNFFSVVIVDVIDYLKMFSDITDGKHPIPLVQKLSVAEIKDKLSKVHQKAFYITDTDDSQLLEMLAYLNNMQPHHDENGKAIMTDMYGFNSNSYDKLMVAGLLMFYNQVNNTKELITKLYELSKHIIDLQDKQELNRQDYFLGTLRKYNLPYRDIDVMKIFALNKVGSMVNDKGDKVYFGKSLKQTSINLQWYELLEHELPPISDADIKYYEKNPSYSGIPYDKLNILIDKWDRYIIPEWIPATMHYNTNDVYIVCEMIRLFLDEIKLRYNLSKSYEVDVMSSSRSNIADRLFVKFYSEFSGLDPSQWRGKKTERTKLSFKRVIFDFIQFKTEPLQELLNEMKQVVLYSIGKKGLKEVAKNYPNFKYLKTNRDSGWFEIKINNLVYTIATGGLHSVDTPRELKSRIKLIDSSTGEITWANMTDDSYVYVHYDIASFYPSLMSAYHIAPKHINEGVFTKLITWLKDTRVKAKHSKEPLIDGIPKDTLAQALKIVINSIYGKLGFEQGDICDRLAVLKVTINGQLMVMMVCEELELNGIEVVSANTDGIVVKLYKRDKEKFDKITSDWLELTKLGADSEEYERYINRDINNYTIRELNGKVSYKGALNPLMYLSDLSKGYDMPVVAKAVSEFFLNDKPIMETLYEARNILDFCKTQNIAKSFHVEEVTDSGIKELQRQVRFYVSNKGCQLFKVKEGYRGNMCAGYKVTVLNTLDDNKIETRDINYTYYYNECIKIIDPIKLQISPNLKANANLGTKSGKAIIKQYSGQYLTLFDDLDE